MASDGTETAGAVRSVNGCHERSSDSTELFPKLYLDPIDLAKERFFGLIQSRRKREIEFECGVAVEEGTLPFQNRYFRHICLSDSQSLFYGANDNKHLYRT
jgi:hypothetical protein